MSIETAVAFEFPMLSPNTIVRASSVVRGLQRRRPNDPAQQLGRLG
jgi:hypothetical protein